MGDSWKLMRSFKNAKKKRELEEQRRKRALEEKKEEEEEDIVTKIKAKAKRAASEAVGGPATTSVNSKNTDSIDVKNLKDPPPSVKFDAIHENKQQSSPIKHKEGQPRISWASKASTTHISPKQKWLAPSSSFSPSSPSKLKFDSKWLNPNKKRRPLAASTTTSENVDTSSPPSTPPLHSQSPQRGRHLNRRSDANDDNVQHEEQKKQAATKPKACDSDSSDTDIDDDELLACFGSKKNEPDDSRRQSKSESSDLKARRRNSGNSKSNHLDKINEDDPIVDSEDERKDTSPRGHRSSQKRHVKSNSQKIFLKSDSSEGKPAAKRSSGDDDSSVSDMEVDNVRRKLHASTSQSTEEQRNDYTPPRDIYVPQNAEHPAQVLDSEDHIEEQRRRSLAEADLWSDSEDEKNDSQKESQPMKRKRRPSSVDKSADSNKKKKKRSSSKNSRRSTSHSPGQYVEPVRGDTGLVHLGEDELRNTLHPTFDKPKFGPFDVGPLILSNSKGDGDDGSDTGPQHQVPASINRYLLDYQREGIQFMYKTLVTSGMGAVLGDDMGLGKTVQVLSLLCALFQKTGTALDLQEVNRRNKLIEDRDETFRRQQERALLEGDISKSDVQPYTNFEELNLSEDWFPVLITVPNTVLQNWLNEFQSWSHFGVAVFHSGGERETALARVTCGRCEILLTTHSFFQNKTTFTQMNEVKQWRQWRLVIIDEFHKFRTEKGHFSKNLRTMKADHNCRVLGMTGTLMQNSHEELWNLIDLVETDFLDSWKQFQREKALPIKIGRAKTADADARRRSEEINRALTRKLSEIYLQRKKETVLGDELPEKEERVILCELSDLQKRIYQHMLTLPDYDLLKKAQCPCDCSRNREFFRKYVKLASAAERLAYFRRNKDNVVKMRKCCYDRPYNPRRFEPGQPEIDPDAVLWRYLDCHNNDEGCDRCPYCMLFAALTKLYKLSSHVAHLQVDNALASAPEGSKDHFQFIKDMEFARVAFPSEDIEKLAGGSIMRNDGIMDDHFELSGKMRVLDKLLRKFRKEDARVLIFSYSTQTLDLIQNYVKAEGHSFLRMDGQTSTAQRTEYEERFKKDDSIFLFLLSTKAMGLGLNLTEANRVIIFDVEWNPSWDEQAQDRAYRIGQTQDVQVIRLVAQGTIDELRYLRQLYKGQLKQETLENLDAPDRKAAPRLFRGVQGDRDRKGELFGTENLLKFKDGSFLTEIWKEADRNSRSRKMRDFGVHDIMQGVNEEECNELLENHDNVDVLDRAAHVVSQRQEADFQGKKPTGEVPSEGQNEIAETQLVAGALNHGDLFRDDRGRAALEEGDDGYEEEMGGASQNLVDIVDGRAGELAADDDSGDENELAIVNHGDFFRDDRGGAAIEEGDDGFDEEMGGGSQNMAAIIEHGMRLELPENPQDGSCSPTEGSPPNSPARILPDGANHGQNSPRSPSRPFHGSAAARLPVFPPEDDFSSRMHEARAARQLSESLKPRPNPVGSHRQSGIDGHDDDSPDDQPQAPTDSGFNSSAMVTRPKKREPQERERSEEIQQGDSSDEQLQVQRVSSSGRSPAASMPSPDRKSPSTPASRPIRSLANNGGETTFTAADIPFPTYRSRKARKKSKKRRKKNDE